MFPSTTTKGTTMGTRFVTAGYGDSCTWGMGHPNDPRTDIDAENAAFEGWATDQYKGCPYELALLKCALGDFDRDLLPQDSVKEYAADKDGSDVVFYLFPHVSSPLKDLLIGWMSPANLRKTTSSARQSTSTTASKLAGTSADATNTGGLTMTDSFMTGALTAIAVIVSVMFFGGVLG